MTEFLTVPEVAARWKVSRSSVYEATRLNKVPLFSPAGGAVRIPLDELAAYERGDVCELEVIALPHGGRRVRPSSIGARRKGSATNG